MDTLLLSTARIATFDIDKPLTNASGFVFERDGRPYLVTSRHVVIDAPSKLHPNRITIDIHTDAGDLPGVNWSSQHFFAQSSVAVH